MNWSTPFGSVGMTCLLVLPLAAARDSSPLETKPTFQSCGLVLPWPKADPVVLRFREKGGIWREGYPPIHDGDRGEYRGSLVNLSENTAYEVEMIPGAPGSATRFAAMFTTWSARVPVGRTFSLADAIRRGGPVIRTGGAADAWVRYDGKGFEWVPDDEREDGALVLEGVSHVILENVTIRGGRLHAIEVRGCKDVRILNADLSGWGRIGTPDPKAGGKFRDATGAIINNDAGVFINQSTNTVLERSFIHDPRGTANPWLSNHPAGFSATHPAGPNAVFVRSEGGTVIRWNDFIGSDGHRWNDGIEGWSNKAAKGAFFRDADICGNMLAFGMDDSTELDGGQMNVRFWGNKVEGFYCGVSITPCILGPSYVYRNLFVNLGDENGWMGGVLKSGTRWLSNDGRTFYFHNTSESEGGGLAGGNFLQDQERGGQRVTTRNNVVRGRDPARSTIYDYPGVTGNDFDWDLTWGGGLKTKPGAETNGVVADPRFVDGASGWWTLGPDSPARKRGTFLPNFSEGFSEPAPDMGCFTGEDGLMPLRPTPVRSSRYELRLATGSRHREAGKEEVLLTAPTGFKGSFKILKNRAFDWLKVEPEGGTLTGGAPFPLRVSLGVPETPRRLLRGVFLVKLEDGFSVPVTVYGTAGE